MKTIRREVDALTEQLTPVERCEMFLELSVAVRDYDFEAAEGFLVAAKNAAQTEEQHWSVMQQRALLHWAAGDYNEVAVLYAEVLAVLEPYGAQREALLVRRSLARALFGATRYHDALVELHQVLADFELLALDSEMFETYLDVIGCALLLQDWELAEAILVRACALSGEVAEPEWTRAALLHGRAALALGAGTDSERSLIAGAAAAEAAGCDLSDLTVSSRAALQLHLAEDLVAAARNPCTLPCAAAEYRALVVELAGTARLWFRLCTGDGAGRCTAAVAYGLGIDRTC